MCQNNFQFTQEKNTSEWFFFNKLSTVTLKFNIKFGDHQFAINVIITDNIMY